MLQIRKISVLGFYCYLPVNFKLFTDKRLISSKVLQLVLGTFKELFFILIILFYIYMLLLKCIFGFIFRNELFLNQRIKRKILEKEENFF